MVVVENLELSCSDYQSWKFEHLWRNEFMAEEENGETAHLRPACVACTYHCNKMHGDRDLGAENYDLDRSWPFFRKKMSKLSLHQTPQAGICIPGAFMEDYPNTFQKGKFITLEGPSGNKWRVAAIERTILHPGWRAFAHDHSLREGDLLDFKLTKPTHFVVGIFDSKGDVRRSARHARVTGKYSVDGSRKLEFMHGEQEKGFLLKSKEDAVVEKRLEEESSEQQDDRGSPEEESNPLRQFTKIFAKRPRETKPSIDATPLFRQACDHDTVMMKEVDNNVVLTSTIAQAEDNYERKRPGLFRPGLADGAATSLRTPKRPYMPAAAGTPCSPPSRGLQPSNPAKEARAKEHAEAIEKAMQRYPGVNPTLQPTRPPPAPGLYILVQHTGDVISRELLEDLYQPMVELHSLRSAGRLARKVFIAWGILQCDPELSVSLSARDVKAINKCRQSFMSESPTWIDQELEAFWLHHVDVFTYSARVEAYKASVAEVGASRAEYVTRCMERYDKGVHMTAEDAAWSWSALYSAMCMGPVPPCVERPFKHTEEEFQVLMAWMLEEERKDVEREGPPPFARALKLFSRSKNGCRVPMLCPVQGLSMDKMKGRPHQILMAMEELIRMGRIFFPTMDTSGEDFKTFRAVLDTESNLGDLEGRYMSWRRSTFVQACVDMLHFNMEDELRRMWVSEGTHVEEVDSTKFRHVLLLRENVALGYSLGSLEAIGVWPPSWQHLYDATKALHVESNVACHEKLDDIMVDRLDADFGGFKPSQVSTGFDVQDQQRCPYSEALDDV